MNAHDSSITSSTALSSKRLTQANLKAVANTDVSKAMNSDTTNVHSAEQSVASIPNEAATNVAQVDEKNASVTLSKADTPSDEQVQSAVENIQGFIQENQRGLDFKVAKESNRIIVTVIDRNTNEIIRQIPPEDAVSLSDRINSGDNILESGLFFSGDA